MVNKFIKKTFLFLAPVLVIALPLIVILYGSGENFHKPNESSSNQKSLVGYAYNQKNYRHIKWFNLNQSQKFDVITLGSSRVLQFRKDMFTASFYNAGYTISSISDFKPFMESIPKEKLPDYLIIGLDQWMFNENWDDFKGERFIRNWKTSFNTVPSTNTLKKVFTDLFKRKYSFDIIKQSGDINKIGLNARLNGHGLRNDGSMYYGHIIQKLLSGDKSFEDYNYSDTFSRIEKGNRRFEYGSEINFKAINELELLLKWCKENEIELIAFLPPYADKVFERMQETEKYSYLSKINSATKPLFKKYDFEFYDFSTVKDCNSSDDETLDGFHGGELTYLKLLLKVLDQNSVLNQVTNSEKLKKDLNSFQNRYIVYKY